MTWRVGRPLKEDKRDKGYRIRLNKEEQDKLKFISEAIGKKPSEMFRDYIDYVYRRLTS